MAFKIVYCHYNHSLEGKKVASFQAAAKLLRPGQELTVQHLSGTWQGYYRQVGIDKKSPKTFWYQRRPAMEY